MYDNGNSQLNTFKHCILLMYISIRAIIFMAYITTSTCLSYMDNVNFRVERFKKNNKNDFTV